MISRVPTVSLKRVQVPQRLKGPMIVVAIALLGSALLWPWATLTIGLIVYLASIPFGIAAAAEMRRHPPEVEN
jgi:CDP-diacylglycerol--serine O-phosphatidyltransferase